MARDVGMPAGPILGIVLAAAATRAGAEAAALALVEVAPGNYVHYGKHLSVEEPGRDDIANIGFIVGERCVAVIDTGGSVAVGAALKAAVREKTPLPVCYVVNTHVHFDHLLGNFAFRDEAPRFVGHAALPEAVAGNVKFFLEHFAPELGAGASAERILGPDLTVEEGLALDLGGRVLQLKAWPRAHTTTDLTVFDPATGTLWAGDLLFRERIPTLDGSLRGWLEVLAALEREPPRRVVPGHGPVSEDPKAALADERRYLETLLREVRAHIAAGRSLEEALEQTGASERGRWQLWEAQHKRNVSRAYAELEWE